MAIDIQDELESIFYDDDPKFQKAMDYVKEIQRSSIQNDYTDKLELYMLKNKRITIRQYEAIERIYFKIREN